MGIMLLLGVFDWNLQPHWSAFALSQGSGLISPAKPLERARHIRIFPQRPMPCYIGQKDQPVQMGEQWGKIL